MFVVIFRHLASISMIYVMTEGSPGLWKSCSPSPLVQWQIRWVKMRFVVDMKSFLVACVAETPHYSLGHKFECWVLVLFLSPVSFQVIKLATSTSFTPACDYSLTKSFLSFFTMNMPQLTNVLIYQSHA